MIKLVNGLSVLLAVLVFGLEGRVLHTGLARCGGEERGAAGRSREISGLSYYR
jgi:hypothetical protein